MITLRSAVLEADFAPEAGLVGCSLRHRGNELLGLRGGLAAYRERGSTFGIPLLHPWANRLQASYTAEGRTVDVRAGTPRVRLEEHGLANHGLVHAWPWQVLEQEASRVVAELRYDAPELLAGFPFAHVLRVEIGLEGRQLLFSTTLAALEDPVPIAFGYHPYFASAGSARADWLVELPAARRLVVDERRLPTGQLEPFAGFAGPLGGRTFDDGFTGFSDGATFAVVARGTRISLTLLEGYPYAQVFAPGSDDVIAFEPMTAPANALATGTYARAEPDRPYTARFAIAVS